MWEWLGEQKLHDRLEQVLVMNFKEGKIRTYDMSGSSSTNDVATDIAKQFESL